MRFPIGPTLSDDLTDLFPGLQPSPLAGRERRVFHDAILTFQSETRVELSVSHIGWLGRHASSFSLSIPSTFIF